MRQLSSCLNAGRWPVCIVMLLLVVTYASAQDANVCDLPDERPDVMVADLYQTGEWGSVGDIAAFSIGTLSCNIGDCWLNWISGTEEHPVIGGNLFRLHDGRMEQVGQSWLKHSFFATSLVLCSPDCEPTDGSHLGVNCADPYDANLNGNQTRLGPKFEVNPATGAFIYPATDMTLTGDAIYKRIQVHEADLDLTTYADALYFIEGQYVTADDALAGNKENNVSYRRVEVTGSPGAFDLTVRDFVVPEAAAIGAWSAAEPGVQLSLIDVPEDGRFVAAAKVSDLGGGMWHYEYAVQNVTSHRAAGLFVVPVPPAALVTNIGFHDVDYHSGEPFDGTDWTATLGGRAIGWATDGFSTNPDANALRWGTLYNFRFDADVPPAQGKVTLGLFRPGMPSQTAWQTLVPEPCNNDGTCESGENCMNCPNDCDVAGPEVCCGDGTCDAEEDSCACPLDCGPPLRVEAACDDGIDNDCDRLPDCSDSDCCEEFGCEDSLDTDGDAFAACDCNDLNNQVWELPGEVPNLTLAQLARTNLTWDEPPLPGAIQVLYDVIRSDDPAEFFFGAGCVASGLTNRIAEDDDPVASGAVRYFLVRATNACISSNGTVGSDSNGSERPALHCP